MTEEQMRASLEELRGDLARYGARLGVVEPCFHKVMQAEPIIDGVWQALRDAKMFDLADKLREARSLMTDGASYAFPQRYKD